VDIRTSYLHRLITIGAFMGHVWLRDRPTAWTICTTAPGATSPHLPERLTRRLARCRRR
jgi:hypothetical protein